MSHKLTLCSALAAVLLLSAACSASESPAEAPAVLVAAPEQAAQQVQPPAVIQPSQQALIATETLAPQPQIVIESTVAPTPQIAGRPSAPAPINSGFRPDPAYLVGATGRPQFVEFFTYW